MADWIDAFAESMALTNVPLLFRKWAGICTLAGAMERKCWIETSMGVLYPNLYVALIAQPGIGKSNALSHARRIFASLKQHHIAPSSMTEASLIDSLSDAVRTIVRPDQVPASMMFNSLQIMSSEMGVLLPAFDAAFMNVLTDLYDCEQYSQTRRTSKIRIDIKAPQINLLAAGTPSYLMNVMPEGAWEQGFSARLILIYSGESTSVNLFQKRDIPQLDQLKKDLAIRANRIGEFVFEPEAISVIEAWEESGLMPKPDHPKLIHYNTRRIAHILKLSMVASMSEDYSFVITADHVQRALDWLLEAEFYMPDIFKAMSGSTHGQLITETFHFVYKAYMGQKDRQPVPKARIINYLQARTPAHNVARVLEVMESSGLLRKQPIRTGDGFVPVKPVD